MRVLYVEDDSQARGSFEKAVEIYNSKVGNLLYDCAATYVEAVEKVKDEKYSLVIIDQKLNEAEYNPKNGIDVFTEIRKYYFGMVSFFTGNPLQVEDVCSEYSVLYFVKGETTIDDVLSKSLEAINSKKYLLFKNRNALFYEFNTILWEKIIKNDYLDYFSKIEDDDYNTIKSIVVTHFNELYNAREIIDPTEDYIVMDNKDLLCGSLIKMDNFRYIVITPPCSFSHGNGNYVTLAKIETISELISRMKKQLLKENEELKKINQTTLTVEKIKEKLSSYLSNLVRNRCLDTHYLPRCCYYDGGVICFDEVEHKLESDITKSNVRVSNSIFVNILSRYGHYSGRPGEKDIDFKKLTTIEKDEIKELMKDF